MKKPTEIITEAWVGPLYTYADITRRTSEGDQRYYVDRLLGADDPRRPHLEIVERLTTEPGPTKILLTGQVGTGKSMELAKVATHDQLTQTLEVLEVDLEAAIPMDRDVNIRYLLLAFAQVIAQKAASYQQKSSKGLSFGGAEATIREWIRILSAGLGTGALPDPSQVNVGELFRALPGALLKVQGARLRDDSQLRGSLQKEEVWTLSSLVSGLARLLEDFAERPILLIADNGDKLRGGDGTPSVFHANLRTLLGLPFRLVLTIPYEDGFASDIPPGIVIPLPNIPIYPSIHSTAVLDSARAFFRELLSKLIPEAMDLIVPQDQVLDEAIHLSAGIPREFVRVIRLAFGEARREQAARVEPGHVATARSRLYSEFRRSQVDPHTSLLLELAHVRRSRLNRAQRRLMGALLVVEYANHEVWYDVHPVLRPEYDKLLAQRVGWLSSGENVATEQVVIESILEKIDEDE